jgi:hypothetical protein
VGAAGTRGNNTDIVQIEPLLFAKTLIAKGGERPMIIDHIRHLCRVGLPRPLWGVVLGLALVATQTIPAALAQVPKDRSHAAIEFKPHPTANISEPQWVAYFALVKTAHGKSMQRFPDIHLVVFEDGAGAYYAFTQPGHPAHPAWITRKLLGEAGNLSMNQIGYFAGDEAAFAKLYQQYQVLTQKSIEQLKADRRIK